MTVAESNCPHCKRKIIVEHKSSKAFPLGIVAVHKQKDYYNESKNQV